MITISAATIFVAQEPQNSTIDGPPENLTSGTARREARQLRRDILAGLQLREFPMQFHPRFAIASPQVTAVEGVVRWQHRRRGAISEAALMALAEKAGATPELQRWAIAAGCEALVGLPREVRLALNLTAWQVRHPGLGDAIDTALREHDLHADQLELTLSESALETLDPEAQLRLAVLFDEGVSLAVGQFGSQVGSLTLLSRFPLDRVKLDAGLTRRVLADPDARAVVDATVSFAHAMAAKVVATGVETEEQRSTLAGLGCDEATGPFYGKAVPGGQLLNLVV